MRRLIKALSEKNMKRHQAKQEERDFEGEELPVDLNRLNQR
jgi:hypothetical protein|tara:strand:- start:327 stop:449 length:123 start_codon:yes stop_codon:yes gene_type:complete